MMSMMAKQNAEIQNLRALLDSVLPQSSHVQALESLTLRVQALEGRTQELERQVLLPFPHSAASGSPFSSLSITAGGAVAASSSSSSPAPKLTVGSMLVDTAAKIAALEGRVGSDIVVSQQLAATRNSLQQETEQQCGRLADYSASREALESLQSAQEVLSGQVSGLTALLSTKVDRTDILRLQSTAAEVQSFAGFKAGASADIKELQQRSEEQRQAIDKSLESLSRLSGVLNAVTTATQQKAEQSSVEKLQESLERLQADVQSRPTGGEFRELVAFSRSVHDRSVAMDASLSLLQDRMERGAKDAAAALAATATQLRTEAAGTAGMLRTDLAALREELEARAYITSLEATDENLTVLTERVGALAVKLEACLKFVDWFAEHGSAYEYNAAALERHMNALAVGNRSYSSGGGGGPGAASFVAGAAAAASAAGAAASAGGAAPSGRGGGAGGGPMTGAAGVRLGGLSPAPGRGY